MTLDQVAIIPPRVVYYLLTKERGVYYLKKIKDGAFVLFDYSKFRIETFGFPFFKLNFRKFAYRHAFENESAN